ncbi:Sgd1p LALA0_S15e00144g [Lachancea lanzarotensis]|uniref:LALA0S15e00144g1_1 n=1 Tax=Lachancea lanzarotensis TaxID=1245769 RepID=A0A0C7NGQ2_9SACH|nr:uncharacterized protein LALA0_S15e00144g [Lachancea lanzarotensis]CEP64910.1 LALA0S15e00144g1_1 [Lachancea lanzarotensis]
MRNEKHGIRIPGTILDELKRQDYGEDRRFNVGKRKRATQLGRKERRKQQRREEKSRGTAGGRAREDLKKAGNKVDKPAKNVKKPLQKVAQKEVEEEAEEEEEVVGNGREISDSGSLPFSSDDELSSSDFDDFGDDVEEQNGQESEGSGESGTDMTAEETMQALKRAKQAKKANKGTYSDDDDEPATDMTAEETMRALKRAKDAKKAKKATHSDADEELSTDMTVEETMQALKRAKEVKKARYSDSDDEPDTEMTAEETMRALKRAKDAKKTGAANLKTKTDKPVSENKQKRSNHPPIAEEPTVKPSLTPSQLAQAERDKWDYDYYAQKLGLKGKKKTLKANSEFDAVGGLLEGLDFFENYNSDISDESESEVESEASNGLSDEPENISKRHSAGEADENGPENPFSSDDEVSEGDFEEFDENDLDEQEWKELRELEGETSDQETTVRENPYVAPTSEPAAYVPPSLRQKNLSSEPSQLVVELRKKVKSSLNKLSVSNITVIVSALNELYNSYPRQHVSDALANQILEIVCQRDKLLDSLMINYAAVVFSLWKLRGTEVGASFLQTWVEKLLESFRQGQAKLEQLEKENGEESTFVMSKECTNLVSFLSYCYNFGMVSSRIIYNVIELLIKTPNEFTSDILLRIISISGQLIRGDDPKALKEIISELLTNVKNVKQSTRMKFLLEVMSDLKNNRLKPSLLAASHSGVKKSISKLINDTASSPSDPLQVTLDDIESIDTKGKWWLVGASWKGNQESAFEHKKSLAKKEESSSTIAIEDNIFDDIPDWSEIARAQRMNTEVRRALFVSVMSAQDFMDAFARIDKLNLKNKQSLEIPRVLLHCLAMEGSKGSYNPFYALLGIKLSQQSHHVAKAFQFIFWDMVKKFEQDDSDIESAGEEVEFSEDQKLKKISCQGRFFGSLLAQEILKLDIFKHVPLMGGLNGDGTLFIEVMVFQFLLSIAKKCEVKKKSGGVRAISFDPAPFQRLAEHSNGFDNSKSVFAALRMFLQKRFKYQAFITEQEGTKEFERQKRRLEWALPEFLDLLKVGLKSQEL